MPEYNGQSHRERSYTNKYQKHIAFSYGYKLLCVDDKFSKPFKTYFGEASVYNFVNSAIEETKYFSNVMKKPFSKIYYNDLRLMNFWSVIMIILIMVLE